jgi:serine/threonine protein kinase
MTNNKGFFYLSLTVFLQILHGDLAARNILVTEQKSMKLCDFGLSKQLYQYSVYIQKSEVIFSQNAKIGFGKLGIFDKLKLHYTDC